MLCRRNACRRNVVSTKCRVDEKISTKCLSTECCVDEVSCRRNAVSTKKFRQNACRRSAASTKCRVDENFSTIICRPTACRQNFVDQQHIYRFLFVLISHVGSLLCSYQSLILLLLSLCPQQDNNV
jgi:hypothetical protein